ncbi:hypothetical protein TURU_086619 [Turdus rufiventris]|nr:hypothetical protein TURU_086619 [Turdus rufiventris]
MCSQPLADPSLDSLHLFNIPFQLVDSRLGNSLSSSEERNKEDYKAYFEMVPKLEELHNAMGTWIEGVQITIIPSTQVCLAISREKEQHMNIGLISQEFFSAAWNTPQEMMALMENAKLQHQECPDKTKVLRDQPQKVKQMSDACCTWQGPEDTAPPHTHRKALL